jgi:hypothetical protein
LAEADPRLSQYARLSFSNEYLSDGTTFYMAGGYDGKIQNFVAPAVFYVMRRTVWKPTHPFLVFAGGMRIATTGFHTYNRNMIFDTRILF